MGKPTKRNSIQASVSFDQELFPKMEARRAQLAMDRSEYVKRCIMQDLLNGGGMTIPITSGLVTNHPVKVHAKNESREKRE